MPRSAAEDQLKQASDSRKAEIEKHIAEVKAENEAQKAELEKRIADGRGRGASRGRSVAGRG